MKTKRESSFGYKMMVWTYKLVDLFNSPDQKLDELDIRQGNVVVDYGCGPGRYLQKASDLVGKEGKVYAADIHIEALNYSQKIIKVNNLKNVEISLIQNDKSSIPDNEANLIYAIDMFHHVNQPQPFFKELYRIIKKDGQLYLEDGHQSRETSLNKIKQSNLWQVKSEDGNWITLTPKSGQV